MAKRSSGGGAIIEAFIKIIIGIISLVFTVIFKIISPDNTNQQRTKTKTQTQTHDDDSSFNNQALYNYENHINGDFPAHLEFDYQNSNGAKSRRMVDVSYFNSDGQYGQLVGYCHKRREKRTFIFPRITSAIELESGESIDSIGAWLKAKYEATDEGKIKSLLRDNADIIGTVYYVAKADDRFLAREKIILSNFIQTITNDPALSEQATIYITKYWQKDSIVKHNQRLRRIAEMPDAIKNSVFNAMNEIVNSSKTPSASEIKALANAKKLMNIANA